MKSGLAVSLGVVGHALAGLAPAYDPRRGLELPLRVVGELHIDGRVATWEAEAGWLKAYVLGAWGGSES